MPGYQEVIVDVFPYSLSTASSHSLYSPAAVVAGTNTDGFQAVKIRSSSQPKVIRAVALRAADHLRLRRDNDPSLRYMKILIEGMQPF